MRYFFMLFVLFGLCISACKKDSKRKIRKNHRQEVGHSANDLLSDKKYEDLVVEVQYMSGFRPSDATVSELQNFIGSRLHKNVRTVFSEITAHGQSTYSLSDIQSIEEKHRSEFTAKKEIAVYFLFLDGGYAEDTDDAKVLGVAYYNTSMAIFQGNIYSLSGGFGQPSRQVVETAVVNHEFGHILGLVNTGTSMTSAHQDGAHGAHCDNSDCLMFWETETGVFVDNLLGGGAVPQLDDACISDLRGNGGK